MTRPAPRKSSLAGSNPVAPPELSTPSGPPVPAADPSGSHLREEKSPEAKPAAKSEQQPKKWAPKVSFYQAPEDTARMRGAFIHTQGVEGSRSLSQFIHNAVMVEVERLEKKYNGGEPFPRVVAKEMPQGRPLSQ